MRGESIDRRRWLGAAAGLVAGGFRRSSAAQEAPAAEPGPVPIRDADEAEVEKRLREAGFDRFRRLRSIHYLALGDAADSFLRATLTDCEGLLADYARHLRTRGFEVKEPGKPLLVTAFADDRSFGRYHGLPSLMQGGAQAVGVYDRASNLLSIFDWRNVPQISRAANRNVQTIAHEAMHQLTFNAGLLDREADAPACVIEGLGTYAEPRKVIGPSDLGRMNVHRADDLAKLRRSIPWIPVRELLTDDKVIRAGLYGKVMLAYAESWALVHLLFNDKSRLPGFRDYLAVLRERKTPEHREADARAHLGDLDQLDRDLQAHAVRLVRAL